jgi:mannose-6-phosphate isomerase-like protein (cupin superfamily)
MEFRDRTEEINAGEIIIVPKGIEHCPRTKNNEEVNVLLVEQKSIKHTGNIKSDRTVEKSEWI